jgi:hypothetical protein
LIAALAGCGGRTDSAASDASTPPGDGSVPIGDGFIGCTQNTDCPQPSLPYCQACFDGGADCARGRCVSGQCRGLPPSCPGPVTNPCAAHNCGDPCEQCLTLDGGCYPGKCAWGGACKAAQPVCSVDAGRGCAPSDAVGVGSCNYPLGWGWDGRQCVAIVGCECIGSDCGGLLVDSLSCDATFAECPKDGGAGM